MRHQTARQTSRESIHDLRNLFGVVASARHMLDDGPPAERRALLLDAIEDAAMRGARLTTALLARQQTERLPDDVDISRHLAGLEPLICALAGERVDIRMDLPAGRLPVRLDPADFDAAILELVANAGAAIDASGTISIRAKRIGKRAWLVVADTGCGMSRPEVEQALRGPSVPSATGTGLGRILQFARAHHGRLHIRSRKGRGTVAFLNLPLVLETAFAKPAVTSPARRNPPKERRYEKRQPVAA